MRGSVLLLLVILAVTTSAQQLAQETCNAQRRYADVEMTGANVVLGGLFGMRNHGTSEYGCGLPTPDLMHLFEAARFTLNTLNTANYIPGVKIGMRTYDTCSTPELAMKAVQEFYPEFSSASRFCPNVTTQVNLGMLGPMYSGTTVAVGQMLSKIPGIGITPRAGTAALSDKTMYPTFLRTGQTDTSMAKAIVSVMTNLRWQRALLVYVDHEFGRSGMQQLLQAAYDSNICFTQAVKIGSKLDVAGYQTALQSLSSEADVAVFFGNRNDAVKAVEALQRVPGAGRLQWIFNAFYLNTRIQVNYARGLLVVQPRATTVGEFLTHWRNLNASNPTPENPWFKDWYMTVNQCKFTDVNYLPYSGYQTICSGNPTNTIQDTYVDPTIKAIYAYATALKTAQAAMCPLQTGICPSLRDMNPQDFLNQYLIGKSFRFGNEIPSLNGLTFGFDSNGDPLSSDFVVYNYKGNQQGTYSFQEVGTYSNSVLQLNPVTFYNAQRQTPLTTPVTSQCPAAGCRNCLLPPRKVHYTYKPGSILLGALIGSHLPGKDAFTCGSLFGDGAQAALAVEYALERLPIDFQSILPGVTLGGLIADICNDKLVAQSFLSGTLSGRDPLKDNSMKTIDTNLLRAFVDFTSTNVAQGISKILGDYQLPEVQAGATGNGLSDRTMYPFFSRDVPSNKIFASAAIGVLQLLNFSYVQVVYTQDHYQLAWDFLSEAAKSYICIANMVMLGNNYNAVIDQLRIHSQARAVVVFDYGMTTRSLLGAIRTKNAVGEFVFIAGTETWGNDASITAGYEAEAVGMISLKLSSPAVSNFNTWLENLQMSRIRSSRILSEWYQSLHNCYLDVNSRGKYTNACTGQRITQSPNFQQSQYVPYVVNAVYAIANALHLTLRSYCNANYRGLCSRFRGSQDVANTLLGFVRNSTFSYGSVNFQMVNGEATTGVTIYNFQRQFSEVGTYDTVRRSILSFFPNRVVFPTNFTRQSTCVGRCVECYYMYQSDDHVFVDGDFILGGIFSLSNPGTGGPYTCGAAKTTNGYQYAAAMMHAINKVNSGTAPVGLKGLKLGHLILDHCNQPFRTDGLLSGVYSGYADTAWIMNQMYPTPNLLTDKIMAWSSDITMSSQEAGQRLQPLNVPLVSPSATSTSLKSISSFYRTIQGDNTVATAMLKLVKSLGFAYVQVVNSANTYGRGGASSVQTLAQQEGVCVTATHEVTTSNTASDIVNVIGASTVQVVILYLGGADADAFLSAVYQHPNRNKLVLLTPEPYNQVTKTTSGNPIVNLLSIKLRSPTLNDYISFLNNKLTTQDYLTDPFMKAYYEALFQCNLPWNSAYSSDCPSTPLKFNSAQGFSQSVFVLSTINTVYAVTNALDAALKELCGDNYSGFCQNYYTNPGTRDIIRRHLERATFRDDSGRDFRFIDREGNSVYDVLRFDGASFPKVGTYGGASLQLDTDLKPVYQAVSSQCAAPCLQCIQTGLSFSYVPGDILLGGLFDVHVRDVNPFSCGAINTLHGFQLLEAFHFALSQVNGKQGMFANILKGVKLGGIGLDSCESAVRTGYLVSNIHNGLTPLSKNGDVIKPQNIDAYIGSYESDRSIYLARILKKLKIPQISYASSSTELLNNLRYPYFYTTVPADDNQARAMISFLSNYNIRYVQILHTQTIYGELGAKAFLNLAAQNRICVAQTVIFPDNGTVSKESANDVVTRLLQKPIANTVVVFAGTQYIKSLLQAVQRTPGAISKFRFIGSETWAVNEAVISGVEEIAKGSVTLNLETTELKVFDDYLSTRTPDNTQLNPWFNEYYQEIQNCYLSIPVAKYTSRCPSVPLNIISSKRYAQDPGVLYVVNAVYSAAYALDNTLRDVCGQNYSGVCEAYRNRPDRRDLLLRDLQNVTFVDPSGMPFSFTDRREGKRGYDLYSINYVPIQGYIYQKIAKYTSDHQLNVLQYKPDWDGSCNRVEACSECPAIRNRGIRYAFSGLKTNDPLTIVGVFDVHAQGTEEYRCGNLNMQGGFEQYLAFTYFVDTLSQSLNMDIRGVALDTCSNSLRVDQDIYSLLATGALCNSAFNNDNPVRLGNVGGFIAMNDMSTQAASRVLESLGITYVSPSAMAIRFDDMNSYRYLARTIAPQSLIYSILASLVKQKGWTYLSSVYSAAETEKFSSFRSIVSQDKALCLGTSIQLPTNPTMDDARNAINQLNQIAYSGVVVLFTTKADSRLLIQAANEAGLSGRFLWVFTDPWGVDVASLQLPAGTAFQALVFEFRTAFVKAFYDYMMSIQYVESNPNRNNKGIPREWFEEFYQRVHQCHLRADEALVTLTQFAPTCSKTELITAAKIPQSSQNKYVLNTIAAAYAMTKGVRDTCGNRVAASTCLSTAQARSQVLRNTLNARWGMNSPLLLPSASGLFDLNFNDKRFWDQGYNLYRLTENTKTPVGQWNGSVILSDPIKDIISACPTETFCGCATPQAPVTGRQTAQPAAPTQPRNFYLYDALNQKVYNWPIWAIVVAVLTCIGLAVSIFVFVFLLVSYPMRGGTTALGFLLQIGIMIIYAVNFAFFLHAQLETCATRRFVMGVAYAIVFACLLVKAVDNWRYSETEYSIRKYSGITSSLALFLIAIGIILIQVIIPVEWLILVPPTASKMSNMPHDWWWCDPADMYDIGLVLSFIFVMFIVLLTAIFASLAWDSDSNYYESRWILYAAISTAGCFLVWMIVTTNAGPWYRDPAVAIGNFVNATALLICIPLRKMVLLIMVRSEEKRSVKEDPYQDDFHNMYTNAAYDGDADFGYPATEKVDSDVGF